MSKSDKILIVDDDLDLLERAEELLCEDYTIKTASSVEKAKYILMSNDIDLVIADLNFEGQEEDGLTLLDFISDKTPDVEMIVLSADRETSRVLEATRRSLVDFIPKKGEYGRTLKNAVALGIQKHHLKQKKKNEFSFLTNSPKMQLVLRMAQKISVSHGDFSIMITGETGTGKEVLAKYLSNLLGKNMVAANMASIPRDTAESELFGHLRGSFTGAMTNKSGLIEQAHGGIFFLDELGECNPSIQAKLLRVIQEREILPLGAVKPKKIDVRFFSATNCDLEKMVEEKTFRLDLLQRLNTFKLKIPPLRERPEDIVLYTNTFLAEFVGNKAFTITGCGMDALLNYKWPGNVRELRNTIERLTLLSDNRKIDANFVNMTLDQDMSVEPTKVRTIGTSFSRADILAVLESQNGNRTKTAAKLGVHTTTLYRWMKDFGILSFVEGKNGRPTSVGVISD